MAKKTTKGKDERKATASGAARAPDLTKIYAGHTQAPSFDPVDFRLLAYDASTTPTEITAGTESWGWDDTDALLTGTLALRKGPGDLKLSQVVQGSRIECVGRYAGRWTPFWRLRAAAPEDDDLTGALTADLSDQFAALHSGKQPWHYRTGKHHPHGWFCHEVAAAAARTSGVLVGSLAVGTKRFHELSVQGSALDAIMGAYAKETAFSGRRFVTRMRNGKLDVVPFQRNPLLYVVADRVTEETVTKAYKPTAVTAIDATGRVGKGKDAKKLRYLAKDAAVARRLGTVTRKKDYGRVRSHAELVSFAKRDLAEALRRTVTGSVTIPGLPFLYRGETHQVIIPEENMLGPDSFIYTTGVSHAVDSSGGGSFFTTVEFTSRDAFILPLAAQEKAIREHKRKARGTKK